MVDRSKDGAKPRFDLFFVLVMNALRSRFDRTPSLSNNWSKSVVARSFLGGRRRLFARYLRLRFEAIYRAIYLPAILIRRGILWVCDPWRPVV